MIVELVELIKNLAVIIRFKKYRNTSSLYPYDSTWVKHIPGEIKRDTVDVLRKNKKMRTML